MLSDGEQIFKSIKEVNSFPFYSAKYYGDYKLHEFMRGAISDSDDIAPFFEDLFLQKGIPVKLKNPLVRQEGRGCSAFYGRNSQGQGIVGKNLDWKRDAILLLKTNPLVDYASISVVNLSFCDIFQLNSLKHNIIMAPYMPMDGMNEKGLVVTMLSMQVSTEYSFSKDKITVGDFNIIRIILDTCRTIDEAIDVFKEYNLRQSAVFPLHYLISDSSGSCIIEFSNGNMHISRNTNTNYLSNLPVLGQLEHGLDANQCQRYAIMGSRLISGDPIDVEDAKDLLKDIGVFQKDFQIPSTIWSIVYEPDELNINISIGASGNYYKVGIF